MIGDLDAPIRIVEFADFQCPACARAHAMLEELQSKYPDRIAVVFRHYPLERRHPYAFAAALASECAAEQGRFAVFHRQLFERQDSIGKTNFEEFARAAGVQDLKSFGTCIEEERYADKIRADVREGDRIGVRATPSLIIGGYLYEGAPPVAVVEQLLGEELQRH